MTLLDPNVTIPSLKLLHTSNYPTITDSASKGLQGNPATAIPVETKTMEKTMSGNESQLGQNTFGLLCLFIFICAKLNSI